MDNGSSPFIAKEIFFTKGVGVHKERLASFEEALRKAGIAKYNLIYVSSIFPPECKVIPRERGIEKLKAGQVLPVVLSRNETNEHRRLISSAIGVAIPSDHMQYGYISEHHSAGETEEEAGIYAEDLAASMLATVLGVEFNPDADWEEKEQQWKLSGKIIKTMNTTQSALGQRGLWTTIVTAAVMTS